MTSRLSQRKKRSAKTKSRLRLAADVGGTFTDVAAFDEATGRLVFGKSLSTPINLDDGICAAVEKSGATFADAGLFLHGATVVINSLLERKGAKTALLVTEGFRDIYEIGRINRPDAYNLFFKKHVPLVKRSLRFEVKERVKADGSILRHLDEQALGQLCKRLKAEAVEAVGIILLHSYRNPRHELRVKEIIKERLPDVFVTASHELSGEYREFERCSTVAANAFVGPKVKNYLDQIDRRLNDAEFAGSFLLVQSTGGLFDSTRARVECVRMLESGPAAGVIGAKALCRLLDLPDAIAFDMGGTSAKAGLIYKGDPLTTGAALVGGYNEALPIQIPMIDVFEVGTGGGSIASLNEAGVLSVGPESAGAVPGPACYGNGGINPTVTDANLVLGRIGADRFLGGEMRLDVQAAARAIDDKISAPLGMSTVEAANGILSIAATAMSYAVKGVSTERGLDAAAFPLIAYGGAGPLHAALVAREIGIERVLVPKAPGHFCAYGMLFTDLRCDLVRTWFTPLTSEKFDDLDGLYGQLAAEASEQISGGGAGNARKVIRRFADMRYVGQEHPATVELPAELFRRRNRTAIKSRFDDMHQLRYGTCAPGEAAEIVSLRVSVSCPMKQPPIEGLKHGAPAPSRSALLGKRDVYFSEAGGYVTTPVYNRNELRAGNKIRGPALVEEHASTTVLLPNDRMSVNEFGLLSLEIGSRAK